jgi:hypothetical protein
MMTVLQHGETELPKWEVIAHSQIGPLSQEIEAPYVDLDELFAGYDATVDWPGKD